MGRGNNKNFEIGQKLGQLEQGQKDIAARVRRLEGQVGALDGRFDKLDTSFKDACKNLSQQIAGIKNPSISLRTVGKLVVGGAGLGTSAATAYQIITVLARALGK